MSELLDFFRSFAPLHQMSLFEIAMLVCFGASWPASVYKLLKTKTSAGKSFLFLWLVLIGYACGVVHKVLYHRDAVILLYLFNLSIVSLDIALSYRYRPRRPREA